MLIVELCVYLCMDVCFSVCIFCVYCVLTKRVSPWYNHTGWLSIKYQGTCYLLSACFSVWVALPWELFAFKSDSIRSLLQNYRLQCTKMITTKHHPLNRLKAFNTSNHRWRVFTPYPLPAICQLHTHTHACTRSHTHTHTHTQTNICIQFPSLFICDLHFINTSVN